MKNRSKVTRISLCLVTLSLFASSYAASASETGVFRIAGPESRFFVELSPSSFRSLYALLTRNDSLRATMNEIQKDIYHLNRYDARFRGLGYEWSLRDQTMCNLLGVIPVVNDLGRQFLPEPEFAMMEFDQGTCSATATHLAQLVVRHELRRHDLPTNPWDLGNDDPYPAFAMIEPRYKYFNWGTWQGMSSDKVIVASMVANSFWTEQIAVNALEKMGISDVRWFPMKKFEDLTEIGFSEVVVSAQATSMLAANLNETVVGVGFSDEEFAHAKVKDIYVDLEEAAAALAEAGYGKFHVAVRQGYDDVMAHDVDMVLRGVVPLQKAGGIWKETISMGGTIPVDSLREREYTIYPFRRTSPLVEGYLKSLKPADFSRVGIKDLDAKWHVDAKKLIEAGVDSLAIAAPFSIGEWRRFDRMDLEAWGVVPTGESVEVARIISQNIYGTPSFEELPLVFCPSGFFFHTAACLLPVFGD